MCDAPIHVSHNCSLLIYLCWIKAVAEKRAETKRKEAAIKAQAELEVAEIQLKIQVANQEAK